MQSLGCDVAALNTVQFSMYAHPIQPASQASRYTTSQLPLAERTRSNPRHIYALDVYPPTYLRILLNKPFHETGNHTGYRQWTGTRVSAQEITDLYQGLKQSYLDDFDMMLSGYVPGAAALEAVGEIAKELKARAKPINGPGSFFWVLDPVMGDNGTLYVAQDVVPVYRSLIGHADLVLPNQFEAEYVKPFFFPLLLRC